MYCCLEKESAVIITTTIKNNSANSQKIKDFVEEMRSKGAKHFDISNIGTGFQDTSKLTIDIDRCPEYSEDFNNFARSISDSGEISIIT